ncbi:MAG: FAD:protein FMN transferase [Phycisphaeraceae bacterium]
MPRRTLMATAFLAGVLVGALLLAWMRGGFVYDAQEPAWAGATREIMSTPIRVLAPEAEADRAAETVFAVFREVDARMSEWKPTSPLSKVNAAAGSEPVELPPDLMQLLHRGKTLGELTGGAFDVTWAALWGLWDFKAEHPQLPDPAKIEQRTALVDYRRLEIDREAGTVHLPREGMLIGLGGIAKGHALDQSAEKLRDRGIESFLISAGGQVYAGGRRGDRPWRVGIRDPRGGPNDYFADLAVADRSVATSGDYERSFILGGKRYHHILDPRTGRPARGVVSSTVVSSDATLADALSTALFIMGPARGLELASRLSDVEALLVDDEGELHMTPGLREMLNLQYRPSLAD